MWVRLVRWRRKEVSARPAPVVGARRSPHTGFKMGRMPGRTARSGMRRYARRDARWVFAMTSCGGRRHRREPVRGRVRRGRPRPGQRRCDAARPRAPRRGRRPAQDARLRGGLLLSRSGGHRLLPSLQGGYRAVRRDGLQVLPHEPCLDAHLPQLRRVRAQRGRPGLLRGRVPASARSTASSRSSPSRVSTVPSTSSRSTAVGATALSSISTRTSRVCSSPATRAW